MIKIILTSLIMLLVFSQPSEARKRKKKPLAGVIEDSTYIDKKFGFSFKLPGDWEPKIKKDKEQCRLILEQVSINASVALSSYIKRISRPTAHIWLVEHSFTAHEFIDSLVSDNYNSKIKDEMLYYLREPTSNMDIHEIKTVGRKAFKVNSFRVESWNGFFQYAFYKMPLQDVKMGGAYFVVKKENQLLVIIVQGFVISFEESLSQIKEMVKTLKWE